MDDLLRENQWKIVECVNHRQIWEAYDLEDVVDVDVVHDMSSSNFVLTVDLGELPVLPNPLSIDVSTIQTSNVNLEDNDLSEEEADEEDEDDEVDDFLIDFCEDDVNNNLVNNDSDSD